MVVLLLKCLLVIVLALLLVGAGRTWQMEHGGEQESFSKGVAPVPLPDGFYAGSVPGHTVLWLGKKFDAANQGGINVFDEAGKKNERYPFATSVGPGLRDATLQVVKIDYDIPGNPFWLRFILDEIVQIAPDHYLGKLHIRIIPGYPFTLAYFELKK